MLKKIVYPLIGVVLLTIGIFTAINQNENKLKSTEVNANTLNLECEAAYLIEETTGKVLYAFNENEKLHPASMTKMMGLLLVCEKIDQGKIKLDDIVTISNEAASMGGSQVFLEPLEKISVNDLLKSVCISSANDSMYALGELVGSSNDNFVKMMNEKAKSLNLTSTNFVNVTGFDDDNHYTSAKDMAIIAQNLLKYKDIILNYTSMYDGYIRENSDNPFWLVNTNKLVKYYDGLDGLKTGFTSKSGFCLTATAKRNNLRLISVVMKAETSEKRNKITTTLMDYGFAQIKAHKLFDENEKLTSIKIKKAKQDKTDVFTKDEVYVIVPVDYDTSKIIKKIKLNDNLAAPLKEKSLVGKLIITVDDEQYEFDICINEKVELLKYNELLLEYLKDILA